MCKTSMIYVLQILTHKNLKTLSLQGEIVFTYMKIADIRPPNIYCVQNKILNSQDIYTTYLTMTI